MQQSSTLVVRFVRQNATDGTLLREQLIAAWQRLQSLYSRVDGPKIYASYYTGAFERVNAAEPVTSLQKFKR